MKFRFFIPFLTAVLLLSLCACAPEPMVLSESEISVLRESYPTVDTLAHSSISFDQAFYLSCAIITAEVSDDWEIVVDPPLPAQTDGVYPYSGSGPVYLPITVEKVLYGDGTVAEGDKIRIFLGSSQFFSGYEAARVGGRYVFFITHGKDNSAYYDETVFGGSLITTAYITEDEYILPATLNNAFDEHEGYSLASYEEILPTLVKDAQKAIKGKTAEDISSLK